MDALSLKQLLVVQAVGQDSAHITRSHFTDQFQVETSSQIGSSNWTGWLGRHLESTDSRNNFPVKAIALGLSVPASLRGARAITIADPTHHGFAEGRYDKEDVESSIEQVFSHSHGLSAAYREIQFASDLLAKINIAGYKPASGARYPLSDLGQALKSTAALIRAGVGIQAVTIESTGWDTHAFQADTLTSKLQDLARSLASFHGDMSGANISRYSVVVMSEFGRTFGENSSAGTDHGAGGAMLLLGPGIDGGRVLTHWPGLAHEQLFQGQDLMPTIDYRDILAEIVERRLGNNHVDRVFPGYSATFQGVTRHAA
jgi:uncharacterized protein (DUF1501 family)